MKYFNIHSSIIHPSARPGGPKLRVACSQTQQDYIAPLYARQTIIEVMNEHDHYVFSYWISKVNHSWCK